MADAQRFARAKNFRFPELYELIECGQVVPQPMRTSESLKR